MNVRGRKDGTVHKVHHINEGPHRIKRKDGEMFTLEGKAYWFSCMSWSREAAIDLVEDAVTCLTCLAAESGVDVEPDR